MQRAQERRHMKKKNGPEFQRFDAIILVGHGSKMPDAVKNMEKLARQLKRKYKCRIVEPCYISFNPPFFPEVLGKCATNGARRIMVVPYFLHDGTHIIRDIPQLVKEGLRQNPGIDIAITRGLGFDKLLVDLVWKRIYETKSGGSPKSKGHK